MRSALLRWLPSLGMLVIVTIFVAVRELSWVRDIGLAFPLPSVDPIWLWLALWPAWIFVSERAARALGLPEPERWAEEPRGTLALRLVGMVVLAPIAEELMFRGLLFQRIAESPLGLIGALSIPALLFAALHLQYGIRECVWILLDGLLYGLARFHAGTIVFPILMHMSANAYACYQRLPR